MIIDRETVYKIVDSLLELATDDVDKKRAIQKLECQVFALQGYIEKLKKEDNDEENC